VTIDQRRRAKNDYNDVDTYGGRAALRLEVGENWVITPSIMGQQQKVTACSPTTPRWAT
jgi:iron complex outermembrane receptor protein